LQFHVPRDRLSEHQLHRDHSHGVASIR
jgi:hypothetical protein